MKIAYPTAELIALDDVVVPIELLEGVELAEAEAEDEDTAKLVGELVDATTVELDSDVAEYDEGATELVVEEVEAGVELAILELDSDDTEYVERELADVDVDVGLEELVTLELGGDDEADEEVSTALLLALVELRLELTEE